MIRLLLFGPPTAESGGDSSALAFERRNQLLAYLALKATWVGRAELANLLWPEQESHLAYANLRKTLFRLQKLSWAAHIELQASAVRFEAATDVYAFEAALREGRIADALPLRRGELLAGFDDDQNEAWSSWLGYERHRLRVAWRDAVLARLALEIEPAEAIDLSARLLDSDPLDEAALRSRMSWLARGGQAAAARQAYRDFVTRLAADLGLAPGAELVAMHDALATKNAPAPAPPSAAPDDDGLIGRTVEMRRMGEQLAKADCRLLTLVGAGGAGKTRLARRAVLELASSFSDGATFVALEDVPAASDIGLRLARDLGLTLARGREALEQVIDHLREQRALLVLDNFEHLVAQAPMLERLLAGCPHLKLVVTSRARLALQQEWTLPVEGLPCPEIEDRARLESFDAPRLFIKAARRAGATINPAAEADAIVAICAAVEGLPLALELAATWTRVLGCEAIAAELRQGTEILRAADPAFPARHASIEAVFERSWQLLTPAERDVLGRLSVLRGGFSAEAARVVASASLPVLAALMDNSLLRRDGARIFLHPLVQELAGARITPEDAAQTARSHARYFHRLFSQLRRAIDDGDRDALAFADAEFENFRAAWCWAAEHEPTLLCATTMPFLYYVDHRRRSAEGHALLRDALDFVAAGGDSEITALLLSAFAQLEYRLDRYLDGEATAREALALTHPERDHEARLQCYKTLGVCYLALARYPEAREYLTLALKQSPASIDPRTAAAMLDNLSIVEKETGNHDEALRLALQSLDLHRRIGDQSGVALVLSNLGSKYLARQEWDTANVYLREALALCDRHGFVGTRAYILANMAEVAVGRGDADASDAPIREGLEVARATGNRALVGYLKVFAAIAALLRSDAATARMNLAEALAEGLAIGRRSLQIECVVCFGEVLLSQGEPACALAVLDLAAGDPLTNALQHEEIGRKTNRARAASGDECAPHGLTFEELVHRIVAESPIAHAPLIATLRGYK
ncbi:ATP-binding protein [Usitatibacter palustris]|uniref:Bacterial transcriptional activator domain-containing protein n=1 Tax=Usitatibacter palustris TaxID=2732487 RepID=A0A6M4HAJ6_9PROT|nr:tetratricopeptide repeat protein [Usitatibacter palustris]QJR16155.1 hypothetical protein DSM104440_02984 [Usitatibacter palustris]